MFKVEMFRRGCYCIKRSTFRTTILSNYKPLHTQRLFYSLLISKSMKPNFKMMASKSYNYMYKNEHTITKICKNPLREPLLLIS